MVIQFVTHIRFKKNIQLKASWCKIVLNKSWRFSSNAPLIRVNPHSFISSATNRKYLLGSINELEASIVIEENHFYTYFRKKYAKKRLVYVAVHSRRGDFQRISHFKVCMPNCVIIISYLKVCNLKAKLNKKNIYIYIFLYFDYLLWFIYLSSLINYSPLQKLYEGDIMTKYFMYCIKKFR